MRWLLWFHTSILVVVILISAITVTRLLTAETLYGRIHGVLTASENGHVLSGLTVSLRKMKSGNVIDETKTDARGNFAFSRIPPGDYQLYIDAEAHEQSEEKITVQAERITEIKVALAPVEPFLKLSQGQRVFTTHETVAIRCHCFVSAPSMIVKLFRLAPNRGIKAWLGDVQDAFGISAATLAKVEVAQFPGVTWVESRDISLSRRNVEGIFRERIEFGTLPASIYLVMFDAGSLREYALVSVSDLGMVVKATPEQVLLYSVDLTSGAPQAGVTLDVRLGNTSLKHGTSNSEGLFDVRIPGQSEESTFNAIGQKGNSLAIANLSAYRWGTAPLRVYTYSDRPIYRPAQQVYFKSIIRQRQGYQYRVPRRIQARIMVKDPKQNVMHTGSAGTNPYGSLSGAFTLPVEALPGYYSLTLEINGHSYEDGFMVAEYRKPEFEVTVTPEKRQYARGDRLHAEVTAQYYFGAPVVNAVVDYYVTRERDYGDAGEESAWDADFPAGSEAEDQALSMSHYVNGDIVVEGKGRTDESGKLQLSLPSSTEKEQEAPSPEYDETYSIMATVTDSSNRSEDGAASTKVTQGAVRMQAQADGYLYRPQQSIPVMVTVSDFQSHAMANQRGTAELWRVTWQRNSEHQVKESNLDWQSDAKGKAQVILTPNTEGDYRLKVITRDRQGRRVVNTCWLWVMSNDASDFEYPYQDIDIHAGKRIYRENEQAEVVVNTRYPGQQALLTIEGERIYERRVVTLKSKSTIITLPLRAEYLPNVQVDVCFVNKKRFFSGETQVNITRMHQALRVQVRAEKAKYQPGEKAIFHVLTTNTAGVPVPADVSFALVDEAVFAIQPDTTEAIISYFYPRRYNQVNTAFSFQEVYYSAENKAGSDIKTRKFFPDTAYWNPSTMTDNAGQATFTVTMPDSLTSWRATCRAATLDTRVGEATCNTIVQKPFLVRLETPRFLTQGDEVEIALIAHNLSDRPVMARLGLEAKGVTLHGDFSRSYRIEPGRMQRITGSASVQGSGNATFRAWGSATIDNEAPRTDAMELTVPVQLKGRQVVDYRSGNCTSSTSLNFQLLPAQIPGTQQLSIRLTPSIASTMFSALDYLAKYPYGCTEQTMSAFLPDLVIKQMMKTTGFRNARLELELPKMVRASLLRLSDYQHTDGSWGWWKHDAADVWMTAYVLFGLYNARQAGYSVTPEMYDEGVSALQRLVADKDMPITPSDRAFVAYVLALLGQRETAQKLVTNYAGSPAGEFTKMGNWGRALLALSFENLGQHSTALAILEGLWSDYHAGRLTRVDTGNDEYYCDSDYTAMLLFAATQLTPDDWRIEPLLTQLMAERREDHWQSTRDTAFMLFGISRYLQHTGEINTQQTVVVSVNGVQVANKKFTTADIAAPEYQINIKTLPTTPGPLLVTFMKSGQGRVYYTATLSQIVTDNLNQAISTDPALSIERTYRTISRRTGKPEGEQQENKTVFHIGDIIEVTVTLHSKRSYSYLMVEDHLPACFEPEDRGVVEEWDWTDWWADQVVRDNQVSFAVRDLAAGKHVITYHLHAQTNGQFIALPLRVFDMYNPGASAESAARQVSVQ